MNMMRRIAGSKWGANKNILKKIYTSRIRPVLEYGITAWSTAATSHMKKISTIQNQAMRIMTGGMKTTPIRSLETATELEAMEDRRDRKVVLLAQKVKRLDNHPLHKRLNSYGSGRLQRSSFISKAKALTQRLETIREVRAEPLEKYRSNPPWKNNIKIKYIESIPGIKNKTEQAPLERRDLTLEYLEESFPAMTWTYIFTDGSAEGATQNGGGGIYYKLRDGSSRNISIPTGKYSSNFRAETEAIRKAANELKNTEPYQVNQKAVILTDALSVISALKNHKRVDYDSLREKLQSLRSKFTEVAVQWIPSHCGLQGNERADELAKIGASKVQTDEGASYQEIRTRINREGQKAWDAIHPKPDSTGSFDKLSREGQVTIFRLRTGHCRLKSHLFNKMKIGESGRCPCSGDMTPEHILQDCPAYKNLRDNIWPEGTSLHQKLFGDLEDLCRTVRYVKETGLSI